MGKKWLIINSINMLNGNTDSDTLQFGKLLTNASVIFAINSRKLFGYQEIGMSTKKRRERKRTSINHSSTDKLVAAQIAIDLEKRGLDFGSVSSLDANLLADAPANLARAPFVNRDILLKMIHQRRTEMQEQMSRLIASMMPASAVPLPPHVLQARRNAVARDALLREFGALTSVEIGEMAGTTSPNRAALAHRWKSDRRIFAVPHQGTNYFPGFQFSEEGQPVPTVGDVIRLLGDHLSPWELALWFTRRNGWLGDRRAVDLLGSEPARVVTAAAREAEELVF